MLLVLLLSVCLSVCRFRSPSPSFSLPLPLSLFLSPCPSPSPSPDEESASVWRNVRLHRELVEHMLRQGHYKSAAALAEQHGLQDLVDMELFARWQSIETSLLQNHDCGPALAWCEENASRLSKSGSAVPLAFQLHLQNFVEVRGWGNNMTES